MLVRMKQNCCEFYVISGVTVFSMEPIFDQLTQSTAENVLDAETNQRADLSNVERYEDYFDHNIEYMCRLYPAPTHWARPNTIYLNR